MKATIPPLQFLPIVTLALAVALSAGNVQSQNLAYVYTMTPKDGQGAGFVAALGQHMEWRAANGDPWAWQIYEEVTGPNLGTFLARSPGHTFADIDAYEASDFAPDALAQYNSVVGPLTASVSSAISATDATVVRPLGNNSTLNLFSLTTYHLKPGQEAAFVAAVNRFHELIVENDYPAYYSLILPVFGITGPQAIISGFAENWASFDTGGPALQAFVADQLGQDGALELFQELAETYTSSENVVLRLHRNLSIAAAN